MKRAQASGAWSEKREDKLIQYFGRKKKLKEGDSLKDLDVNGKINWIFSKVRGYRINCFG